LQPEDVKSLPAVSVLTVPPPETAVLTPDPGVGSSHLKLSVVCVLFQPSAVRAGLKTDDTTGACESSL
jgi:hypothetical protein